jgi:beta-lactam-binding protein with PASTA domain
MKNRSYNDEPGYGKSSLPAPQDKPAKKESPRKTTGKNKSSVKRLIVIALLNLLGMAAVVVLVPYIALRWLDGYTNHNETYEVPDVCGIQLEEAIDVLAANKLNYTIVERRYQENALEDEVVVQYPSAGSDVKEGRKVGLVINTAEKPKRTIPSVIDNRTYREAESHIRAAGFVIGSVDSIPGEKDWVYELHYNGRALVNGEAIPQGSTLTVKIGNGRPKAVKKEPVFDPEFDI